jgi:hypothetical protein
LKDTAKALDMVAAVIHFLKELFVMIFKSIRPKQPRNSDGL